MIKLLKAEDKEIIKSANFSKNAVFYKDMLAFYDAFEKITENKDKLPNFCFLENGDFCLEGICLFMKMYATEFKFETLRLTLNYLEVIYYALATYANDDCVVDGEVVIEEFNKYKQASKQFCSEYSNLLDEQQKKCDEAKQKCDGLDKQYLGKKYLGKTISMLGIVMLVLTATSLIFPVYLYTQKNLSTLNMFLFACGEIVVGIALASILRIVGKKCSENAEGFSYENQNVKKEYDEQLSQLSVVKNKYNRLICEKYEFDCCFFEIFSHYLKTLSIEKILSKAKQYKLKSNNITNDLRALFLSQQQEINDILADLDNVHDSNDYQSELSEIYARICGEDWLYYNSEIRLQFIKKFLEIAEKRHCWTLLYNDDEIDPFGVKTRDLSRERVAFYAGENRGFITSSLFEFMQTKYISKFKEFSFDGHFDIETVRNIKSNYLNYFYNYGILFSDKDAFYNERNYNPDERVLTEAKKIPTFLNLKLKLMENALGYGNNDAKAIKQIASTIIKDSNKEYKPLKLLQQDISYVGVKCEDFDEQDDRVIYKVGTKEVVGYKIN